MADILPLFRPRAEGAFIRVVGRSSEEYGFNTMLYFTRAVHYITMAVLAFSVDMFTAKEPN